MCGMRGVDASSISQEMSLSGYDFACCGGEGDVSIAIQYIEIHTSRDSNLFARLRSPSIAMQTQSYHTIGRESSRSLKRPLRKLFVFLPLLVLMLGFGCVVLPSFLHGILVLVSGCRIAFAVSAIGFQCRNRTCLIPRVCSG